MKFNESITVEHHILKFLQEELGYEFIKPEEFKTLRKFETEYLIDIHLIGAIKQINNIDDDTVAQSVLREVKKIDTNDGFLQVIREGVDLVDSATRKSVNYKIVDLRNPEENKFVLTNQFYFEGNTENIRPDILLFVNGIPLVDIEAKSATASLGVDYTKAIGQMARYQRVARKLFIPNAFNVATDGIKTVYGATGSPAQYYLTWREGELAKQYNNHKLNITLAGLLSKERICDILENFIVFEQTRDGLVKKVARYQQLRAANKIVERVVKGEEHKGLVWHTQGSGKTLTMFFAAWKLRFEQELKNPKIFILVDRVDLDDQVYDEFINHGGEAIIRVRSRVELEEAISSDVRGIFISTIQKFSELGKKVENLSDNIIVLSDEAHRSDEGVAGINLQSSLGNAFFFGFTGTPIDKKQLNTHRNYGADGERYLDYYSIQEAIEDGATLPVTYEARLSKFAIDESNLDEQFVDMTSHLSDEQRNELLKKYTKKSALVKLDHRVEMIARDIAEHYKLYVQPSGFKAQVVCYDREATSLYKQAFDSLLPPEWSAVVYSSGDPNTDAVELQEHNTSKKQRDEIIRNFKNSEHPLRLILVCDMLLTGFDAPIEQVMYLDKPLRDHTLLQAIARTNRVYPNKEAGKIIDYYGITRNLHDALDFDEDIIDSAMIDIEVMKEKFEARLKEIMELFGQVNIEDPSNENLRKNLRIFIDSEDKQLFFAQRYNRLKSLFEFLSPDPFLKPHIRTFEWLTSFYIAFQKEFRGVEDAHILSAYGGKVQALIKAAVNYEGITKNFRELNIGDIYELNKRKDMNDEEKALNMEKVLKQEISEHLDINPVFQSFSERLKKIKEDFEGHQMDLSDRIKEYDKIFSEMKDAGTEAAKHGFDMREYGMYMTLLDQLENYDEVGLKAFIRDISDTFKDLLDDGWKDSSKKEIFVKDIRKTLQEKMWKEYKDALGGDTAVFSQTMNRLFDIAVKRY